ncbi:hypothetical protein JAAARDRAFT_81409 [Jaapia argillacea MUCL 33604]|uniref:Uncharacterized protein n=1 Tax=Jaapia argillacea MUCL 33604 TaxID=933084 RepID=A0A067PKP5_9AGAM|nr:hypothetical protein JAAARDRAFT_81409 [Jaapia argillacea MUCL 33604]
MAVVSANRPTNRLVRKPAHMGKVTFADLQVVFKFSKNKLNHLRGKIQDLVKEYVDVNRTWASQDPERMKALKHKVVDRIPALGAYEDSWPVEVIARCWLKKERECESYISVHGMDTDIMEEYVDEDLVDGMPPSSKNSPGRRSEGPVPVTPLSRSTRSSRPAFASTSAPSTSSSTPSSPVSQSFGSGGRRQNGSTSQVRSPATNSPTRGSPTDPENTVQEWLEGYGIEDLYERFAAAGITSADELGRSAAWSEETRRALYDKILGEIKADLFYETQLGDALRLQD